MTAPPLAARLLPVARDRSAARGRPTLGGLVGGVAAAAATAAATVAALLFAAALAAAVLLIAAVLLLVVAAVRVRGGRSAGPAVIAARWTGYGWDAR